MITDYQSGHRSMAESAAYLLTLQSAHPSTHQVVVCLVTRQLVRQGTRQAMPYKVSLYFSNQYANSVQRSIYTLSIYGFRSSNLTIEEPFFKNSSDNLSHCFCAVIRILLLPTGCSYLHHHRTTRCLSWFFFFHFLKSILTCDKIDSLYG